MCVCVYIYIYYYIGERNGNPLLYSCLENPTDRAAWWATVHGIAKNWTRLSNQDTPEQPSTYYYIQI